MVDYLFRFLILLQLICAVFSLDLELTIKVEPRKEECFYQEVKKDKYLEAEYQVINGGQGDLDIDFKIISPSGQIIAQEFRKADGIHREHISEEGDYRICLDNSISRFNQKVVILEVSVAGEDDDEPWDDEEIDFEETPEDAYEMKIQDIQDILGKVRTKLSKARHLQDELRSFEARDRNVAENSFTRVNSWSMFQMFAMMMVGLIQVVMLKSLFNEKSAFHRMWR